VGQICLPKPSATALLSGRRQKPHTIREYFASHTVVKLAYIRRTYRFRSLKGFQHSNGTLQRGKYLYSTHKKIDHRIKLAFSLHASVHVRSQIARKESTVLAPEALDFNYISFLSSSLLSLCNRPRA
jgi:hypothetical protein